MARLRFRTDDGYKDYAPPKDKWQLQQWVELLFGFKVTDKAVCPQHQAPLDALAASYFAKSPVAVWYASRGFGGKTTLLGALAILELLDGANVNILGGSSRQSQRVHEVEMEAWNHPVEANGEIVESPLKKFIADEPTTSRTRAKKGNSLYALTASQTSVRGPHPQRLRLDEVDEIDWDIYEAAMGQAMGSRGIRAQTTLSSTMQYSAGTFKQVLDLAAKRSWPIFKWCYKETSVHNGGWLTDEELADKRMSVTEHMWETEYDLDEPSTEGLLWRPDHIEAMFDLGWTLTDEINQYYEFEDPVEGAKYVCAADWAKTTNFTEIVTIRYDEWPARLVAFERLFGMPYPEQFERFNWRCLRYPGKKIHDATGVGVAAEDYVPRGSIDYKISSKPMLHSPYVLAVEKGEILSPHIASLKAEHKNCTREDIYGSGHPPDGIVAMALGWLVIAGKAHGKKKRPGKVHAPVSLPTT